MNLLDHKILSEIRFCLFFRNIDCIVCILNLSNEFERLQSVKENKLILVSYEKLFFFFLAGDFG